MGKVACFIRKIAGAVIVCVVSFCVIGCEDGRVIIIEEPVELLLQSDWNKGDNKVVAILKKGDTGKIVDIRYSKDSMFYKVIFVDGREGYVEHIGEGKAFHVLSK